MASTQPASGSAGASPSQPETSPVRNLDLIIHPVKLAVTVQAVPYRLDDITGTVRLSNGKVQLTDLVGKHGDGTIRISGSGAADKTDWDLRLSAEKITVDDAFRKALPGGLASVVDGLKLNGMIGFEFPKLSVRDADLSRLSTSRINTSTTTPSTPLDVDFDVKLAMNGASIDVGVPMTKIDGHMELEGTVRGSKLAALAGPLDLTSTEIAGRRADDVHAEFFKPDDQDALRIGKITGHLAGGDIWGHVDLAFPDVGDSRYRMSLTLRNADVRDLSGITDQNLSGEVSASYDMEGGWTDTKTRRGRGDVVVTGKEMYKIPLVLGLLQITNLSLPLTSPFTNAGARYTVDGNAVTFESIELRGNDMLMSGSGKLDFTTKKVNMTFTTDNPNWPKIPIVGELAQAAKHELLQIHVKGTLEDPKVSATAVNTVTTTVDEVFQGNGKK